MEMPEIWSAKLTRIVIGMIKAALMSSVSSVSNRPSERAVYDSGLCDSFTKYLGKARLVVSY